MDDDPARRDFTRGLNFGLMVPAVGICLVAAALSVVQVPHQADLFRSANVELPHLTYWVVKAYLPVSAVLLLLALACLAATIAWSGSRGVSALNGLAILGGLSWIALVGLALHLPFRSIFRGIGGP